MWLTNRKQLNYSVQDERSYGFHMIICKLPSRDWHFCLFCIKTYLMSAWEVSVSIHLHVLCQAVYWFMYAVWLRQHFELNRFIVAPVACLWFMAVILLEGELLPQFHIFFSFSPSKKTGGKMKYFNIYFWLKYVRAEILISYNLSYWRKVSKHDARTRQRIREKRKHPWTLKYPPKDHHVSPHFQISQFYSYLRVHMFTISLTIHIADATL